MDSIVLAHVADAITHIIDVDSDYSVDVDYDEVADQAARLLRFIPQLAEMVEQWNAGAIEWDALVEAVRATLAAESAVRAAIAANGDL